MLLLLIANTLEIAADVAAMGEVAELVTGFNRHPMTAVFVFTTLLLQVFVPYHRRVSILKWLTLSLISHAVVLFTAHVPWGHVVGHVLFGSDGVLHHARHRRYASRSRRWRHQHRGTSSQRAQAAGGEFRLPAGRPGLPPTRFAKQ